MKLWNPPKLRIYVDMDGVMINSRDNAKRMEGKVGLVWSVRPYFPLFCILGRTHGRLNKFMKDESRTYQDDTPSRWI